MKTFKWTVPEENEWEFNPVPFCSVALGFVIVHLVVIFIDWNLRDNSSLTQPMPGGIPEKVNSVIILVTLALFSAGSFRTLPNRWSGLVKFFTSIALSIFMLAVVIFMRIYYVLTKGIDTL